MNLIIFVKQFLLMVLEENVGHRMEVMNDLQRNLEIIYNIISKIKC